MLIRSQLVLQVAAQWNIRLLDKCHLLKLQERVIILFKLIVSLFLHVPALVNNRRAECHC
jgi:hypothetical protein